MYLWFFADSIWFLLCYPHHDHHPLLLLSISVLLSLHLFFTLNNFKMIFQDMCRKDINPGNSPPPFFNCSMVEFNQKLETVKPGVYYTFQNYMTFDDLEGNKIKKFTLTNRQVLLLLFDTFYTKFFILT